MRKIILSAIVAGASSLAAGAAQAGAYSLEAAVTYALEHNPELLVTREQANAASARSRIAASARLPEIGVSYSARTSNNPLEAFSDKLNTRSVTAPDFEPSRLNDPGTSDLYAAQLSLRLPLYAGGRLRADLANADELERNARLQMQRAEETTAYRTIEAYLRLQAAERGLAIADDAVAAARQHALTTARLVRQGRIVLSDKLTAEVNLAAVQGRREQAVNRAEQARDRLKLVMGLPLDVTVSTAAQARWRIDEHAAAADLPNIERRALENRRDLASARALQEAAEARVSSARSVKKPHVDVIASSNWYDDHLGIDNHSWSVMGVVSASLYAGGRHTAEIAAARYEARGLALRVRAIEQAVQNDVRSAYNNLREARARYAIARENVSRARETVRLVNRRYGQGRTLLIDLLQAERALVEARTEELTSALNVQVGIATLQYAAGALDYPGRSTP